MTHSIRKPDLLDVLARRHRTVANFLETKNVKTQKDLETLLPELMKEFFISGEFYRLCGEVMSVPVIPILSTDKESDSPVFVLGSEDSSKASLASNEDERKEEPKKTTKKRTKKD